MLWRTVCKDVYKQRWCSSAGCIWITVGCFLDARNLLGIYFKAPPLDLSLAPIFKFVLMKISTIHRIVISRATLALWNTQFQYVGGFLTGGVWEAFLYIGPINLILSFHKYLLGAYCVAGTILNTGFKKQKKRDQGVLCLCVCVWSQSWFIISLCFLVPCAILQSDNEMLSMLSTSEKALFQKVQRRGEKVNK